MIRFMPQSLASATPGHLGCYRLPVSMVTEALLQVSEKLKLAEKTALDIDRLRDGYRPAARRGAILFFVLSEMALVNSMYQYSLIAFLEVFGLSLKKSLPDSILLKRLKNIMDTLTFNIYNYGCTGEGRKSDSEHRNLAGLVPAAHIMKGGQKHQLLNHIFSEMRFTGPKSHLPRPDSSLSRVPRAPKSRTSPLG